MKTRGGILILIASLAAVGCPSTHRGAVLADRTDHFPNARTAPLQIELLTPDLTATKGVVTLLKGTNEWSLCFAPQIDSSPSSHRHVPVQARDAEKTLRNASYLIKHGYRLKCGDQPPAKPSVMRVTMTLATGSESADFWEMRSWDYPQDFDDVPELSNFFGWLTRKLPQLKELMTMETQPSTEGDGLKPTPSSAGLKF